MIIDCFPFFNEFDILQIRFEELYDVVDYFVIVEADHTHTGKPKPWNFEENKFRYSQYASKIIYIQVTDMPNSVNPWENENYQRNAISRCFEKFKDDDIILISDFDEIPNSKVIIEIKNGKLVPPFRIGMYFYNYNFNCRVYPDWVTGTVVFKLGDIRDQHPQKLRFAEIPFLHLGGWHFSWFGDEEYCKNKIRNFVHQELNNESVIKNFSNRMKTFSDYFSESGRNWKFEHVPLENTLPECVLNKKLEFIKKYIFEDVR